jgi:HSP20 family molecular chaperone IbpA
MLDIYRDPVWEFMDFFADPLARKIENKGLSNIRRPHNLTNVKDSDGNIIAQKLTVVTTPFKKDDVSIKLVDDILTVECGTKNIEDAEYEETVYRGISSQSYKFSLKLGEGIDKKKITAENKDGMLTINLPMIVVEEKKPEEIEIAID